MRKLISALIILIVVFAIGTTPIISNAREIDSGVEQQIDSRIISVKEVFSFQNINSNKVNVEVKYDVSVTPPKTFYYTKTKKGVKYGGTLDIVSIRCRSDANYALYSGYIYPLE